MTNDGQRCSRCPCGEEAQRCGGERNTPPARRVLSVPEAAEVLGISRSTAYELVAAGELRSFRLGRRVLVPLPAIEALIEGEGR